MKYISFIDELEIDLETLSNLDSSGIIRLQKKLKAKANLENTSNLGETSNLINSLKDPDLRKFHVFIESHLWLKQLIMGNFETLTANMVKVNKELLYDIDSFKFFIAPFLRANLKPFLSHSINKAHYNVLLEVLKHNYLFSEESNQQIISFFKAKLNFATAYISEGKLKQKEYPVAYVSKKIFFKCLNHYPDVFDDEIHDLNSEVIDIYNTNRYRTSSSDFLFSARCMVGMSILDTSNVFLKETLVSNAGIAREYTLPSYSKSDSGSIYNVVRLIFVLIIIGRVIYGISKTDGSSIYSPNSSPKIINISNRIAESNNISKFKKIKTIYPIIGLNKNLKEIKFEAFDNPYQESFKPFYEPKTSEDISRFDTYINNKTGKELILFVLHKNYDRSVFIPTNDSIPLQITSKDSLIFYSGNEFVKYSNEIKFFKRNAHMSNLYIIDSINFEKQHAINVFKETDSVNQNSGRKYKKDSIHLKNVYFKTESIPNAITISKK